MNSFDVLDEIMLKTDLQLFGRMATLYPMKIGAAGPNSRAVAETDPARPVLVGVRVIRSEWAEGVAIGGRGSGLPRPPGDFKTAAAGAAHIATLMPKLLGWTPQKGDELVYDDRPDARYRLIESKPDGGAGLHFGLAKV